MVNLITMAGKGKRYAEAGYLLPKPLIDVDGQPMVWRVIDDLPAADKWIFVVNQAHIDDFSIDKVIKMKLPQAIVTVDHDLLGGASIFCAEQYVGVDEEVFIASCDNGYLYNQSKHQELKMTRKYDCIMWTFTNDQRQTDSPQSWGYAVLEDDQVTIKSMSVKIPISDNPKNDHSVTAAFWLSSGKVLYSAIRRMMQDNIKINNEFYLDMLPVVLNSMNKKSAIFDVDLYVGWGTPKEKYAFDCLRHHQRTGQLDKSHLSPAEIELWKQYFAQRHYL